MALFSPSESPAVVVKEIDLTGGVPNVQSTTGAIVGNFRWGPAEERSLIANETELVEKFASPDSDNTVDFHSASFFLRYSSSLQVVRSVTSEAKNSIGPVAVAGASAITPATIKNKADRIYKLNCSSIFCSERIGTCSSPKSGFSIWL